MKLEMLWDFLMGEKIKELPVDEQKRLMRQYGFMCAYEGVLKERMANFK
jgi:hypothetical protein